MRYNFTSIMLYHGQCHCGDVAFEVEGELREVLDCNCSICVRKGYLHWIVAPGAWRMLSPMTALSTYTFNTGVARHYFCTRCGVTPFYVPRSHPDHIDVNVRCLEGVDLGRLVITPFDGRHWETAMADLGAAAAVSGNRGNA